MHYIKDIIEKKNTEHAHNKFIRYSKGNFIGPLMKIRFSKQNIKIGASFHFTDELLRLLVEKIGNEVVHIKGFIIWNGDLSEDLASLGIKYSKVSKSRGIFKYTIDNEAPLKDFMDKMGNYNLLLTVKTEELSLTTKSAFPKPNKPFGPDFCKVTLPIEFRESILREFAFDVKEEKLKVIEIKHEIDINDIHLPDIDDFEKARRLAKREGKLRRYVSINGSEFSETKLDFNI